MKPGKHEEGNEKPNKDQGAARAEGGLNAEQPLKDSILPGDPPVDPVIPDLSGGVIPTGIQTGQTTRGSYSTDPSTGAGRYADHRAGTFGMDDVAQPGNDQLVEPDPIDPKI